MVTDNTPGAGPVLRLVAVKVRDGYAATLMQKCSTTSADVVRDEAGDCGYFFARGMLTDAGRLVFASLWKDLDAIKQRFGEDWQVSFLPEGYEDMIEEHTIRHIDLSGGLFLADQIGRETSRDADGSN